MFPCTNRYRNNNDNSNNSCGGINMNQGSIEFGDVDYAFAVSGMGNYSEKVTIACL